MAGGAPTGLLDGAPKVNGLAVAGVEAAGSCGATPFADGVLPNVKAGPAAESPLVLLVEARFFAGLPRSFSFLSVGVNGLAMEPLLPCASEVLVESDTVLAPNVNGFGSAASVADK
eukprot:scaffold215_cov423-Prasinococcus_capsulatus_cf.AAC.1